MLPVFFSNAVVQAITCSFLRVYHCNFFVLSVSVLYRLLCMLKVFKFKRVKVRTKRSSSLPQKTLLLKRLRSSPAFNSVTFRHHATSPCLTYSTYTYSSASLAHKNVFSMAALLSLALLSQVCAS